MNMVATYNGWIGVDLDGTLAFYDEWKGAAVIGAPIMPMVLRVKAWLAEGREVRIFTARAHDPISIVAIQEWTKLHIGQPLRVTCEKDYMMEQLWDDRAVGVEFNTGNPIGHQPPLLDVNV